jgi:hypothetical protein
MNKVDENNACILHHIPHLTLGDNADRAPISTTTIAATDDGGDDDTKQSSSPTCSGLNPSSIQQQIITAGGKPKPPSSAGRRIKGVGVERDNDGWNTITQWRLPLAKNYYNTKWINHQEYDRLHILAFFSVSLDLLK